MVVDGIAGPQVHYDIRRILDGVDIPSLGDDTIFYHSRVGDKGVDSVGGHHRHRVAVVDGRGYMLLLLRA